MRRHSNINAFDNFKSTWSSSFPLISSDLPDSDSSSFHPKSPTATGSPVTFVNGTNQFSPVAGKKKSTTFFDFEGGQVETEKKWKLQRGEQLKSMIHMDTISADIFRMDKCEVLSHGNCKQMSTQTNEDPGEESTQTESIELMSMWTQKPPAWSTLPYTGDIRIARQEALGVGTDVISEHDQTGEKKIEKQFDFLRDWDKFSSFISRASRVMLVMLESQKRVKLPGKESKIVKCNRALSALNTLLMHTLTCDGEFIACSNGQAHDSAKYSSKNMVIVWSLKEPSVPLHFLRVWGKVTAIRIQILSQIVVAATKDGSLNFWNLDEQSHYHKNYQDHFIRTPSVNTSCMKTSNHEEEVLALSIIPETHQTVQVLSLDKSGVLISWSCVRSKEIGQGEQFSQHNSAWSTIHVSLRKVVHLAKELDCGGLLVSSLSVWSQGRGDIIVKFLCGSNAGYVIRGTLTGNSGVELNKISYDSSLSSSEEKAPVALTALDTCFCDTSENLQLFAVLYDDGLCRIFNSVTNECLLTLDCGDGATRVKWSETRASLIYIKLKDKVQFWDLLHSDVVPWKTLSTKGLTDLYVCNTAGTEILVTIVENELLISMPEYVKPLSSKEEMKLFKYFQFHILRLQ